MPSRLLTRNFVAEFEERVNNALQVQIASAWMTENRALNALLAQGKCQVRAIIGIHGNATVPSSLELWARSFGWESLRIGGATGVFHPKLFLFRRRRRPTMAWIGSANFTGGGMETNTELVLETDDRGAVAAMEEWFNKEWAALTGQDVEEVVAAYGRQWKRPDPSLSELVLPGRTHQRPERRIQVRAERRRKHELLCGKIIYDESDRETYQSAADGLRKLLARLADGREDEFLSACRLSAAFQVESGRYYVAKGRTKEEADSRGKVYYPSRTITRLLDLENSWSWWISENSNNERKWSMAKAAVGVANTKFGDRLVLDDQALRSWPDKIE